MLKQFNLLPSVTHAIFTLVILYLKHQIKIKMNMRRSSLQRCHTDTIEEEKGSKMKKTFVKTKKECGAWLLDKSYEL